MRSRIKDILLPNDTTTRLVHWFSLTVLLSLLTAIASEQYYLVAIPPFLLLVFLTVVDFSKVYYLLLFCIPLSTEIFLPNGLSTDLPTEPLIVGLMFVFLVCFFSPQSKFDSQVLKHPITLLLLLHVAWGFFSTITSHDVIVSFKFMLAKTWYICTFFFLTTIILRNYKDYLTALWCIFIPLMLTILIIIVKHATLGFAFDTIYQVLHPFYRNHVTYAAIMAVFIPILWFWRYFYPTYSFKWWLLVGSILIMLAAIQLSYTRAAYLAVFIAIGAYYIIRWRLTKYVLVAAVIVVVAGLNYLAKDNTYLEFAPNYETTVAHTDFNNLVEATYQLEDISTMERVYRWVAGFNMINTEPLIGFGPGNFYFFYKGYTVRSFETYVSDNPEQSGIHSYYLMLAVEQGIPGMLIFVALVFYSLLAAERMYHQIPGKEEQWMVMAGILSFIVILSLLLINDLVETDKIGSFFFIILAILVNQELSLLKKDDVKEEVSSTQY